jgi:hypothetical protein
MKGIDETDIRSNPSLPGFDRTEKAGPFHFNG